MNILTYAKDNWFIIGLTCALIGWFIFLKLKDKSNQGYFQERKLKKLEKKALKKSTKQKAEKEKKKYEEEIPKVTEPTYLNSKDKDMMSTLIEQKKHANGEMEKLNKLAKQDFEYEKKLYEYYTSNNATLMQRKNDMQRRFGAWETYLENIEVMIKHQEELKEELK